MKANCLMVLVFVVILSFGSQVLAEMTGSPLEGLPYLKDYSCKRYSSSDVTGGRRDFVSIEPGETVVLADIVGAGCITHIWFTIGAPERYHLRKMVLRMYWDDETNPSVECPVGDFFGLGHGQYYIYASTPFMIGTNTGLNCFFPMPFGKSARIEVTNEGGQRVGELYYYVDYKVYDKLPENAGRFHAKYRQEKPCRAGENYLILDAQGRGHYVGCNLSVKLNADGWWGEGDDMIYVDGEELASFCGTGSEDYFCGSYCYGAAFSHPYFGCPLRGEHQKDAKWNVYRYHIEDPIPFKQSIKVTIEHGHANDRADDFSSVAYWYQVEPHKEFFKLPAAAERVPELKRIEGAIEGEKLLPPLESSGDPCDEQYMGGFDEEWWSNESQLWFRADEVGDYITLAVSVDKAGEYEVIGYFTKASDYGIFQLKVDDNTLGEPFDGYNGEGGGGHTHVVHSGAVSFGKLFLAAGKHYFKNKHYFKFEVIGKNESSVGLMIGIDCLLLKLVAG